MRRTVTIVLDVPDDCDLSAIESGTPVPEAASPAVLRMLKAAMSQDDVAPRNVLTFRRPAAV